MKTIKELFYFDSKTLQYKHVSKLKAVRILKPFLIIFLSLMFLIPTSYQIFDNTITKQENIRLNMELREINYKVTNYQNHLNNVLITSDSIYRQFLGVRDLTSYIRNPPIGGVNKYPNRLIGYSFSDSLIKVHDNVNLLLTQINMEKQSYLAIINKSINFVDSINKIPSIPPIQIANLNRLNGSPFGMRMHPILNKLKLHKGVDFIANTGVNVHATADGIISKIDTDKKGFGKFIKIDHGNGYATLYAHLSEFNVIENQIIKRGAIIGLVGNTGLSTGPHLHYEIRLKGTPINPIAFYGELKSPNLMALL